MEDYDPATTPGGPTAPLTPAVRALMQERLDAYLERMAAVRPASHADKGTVFAGSGGRALLLLKLHAATANASFLAAANGYVAAMEARLPRQRASDAAAGFVGFQWSHVGMLCVGAVAAQANGDDAKADGFAAQVAAAVASRAGRYDDFDSGRAGLLYAVRFLEANLKPRMAEVTTAEPTTTEPETAEATAVATTVEATTTEPETAEATAVATTVEATTTTTTMPAGAAEGSARRAAAPTPRVPRADVLDLALEIIDRGAATAAAHGAPGILLWHGPNDGGLWLGQSHGASGVLQQLLAVPELVADHPHRHSHPPSPPPPPPVTTPSLTTAPPSPIQVALVRPDNPRGNATARALLTATFEHIVTSQLPSGNFPTEYYNATQDYLVQWDHGAPGVSAALLAAADALGDARYTAAAARALECTWRRGLVLKGLMNCHGIGGNTWMQLHAARATRNATYLYRALAFQRLVLQTPLLSDLASMRQPQPLPDGPWQFWTGSVESAIELWTDLLYRGPANASETGWEARL